MFHIELRAGTNPLARGSLSVLRVLGTRPDPVRCVSWEIRYLDSTQSRPPLRVRIDFSKYASPSLNTARTHPECRPWDVNGARFGQPRRAWWSPGNHPRTPACPPPFPDAKLQI